MGTIAETYLKVFRNYHEDREKAALFFAAHLPNFPVEPASVDLSISGATPWITFPYDRILIKTIEECLIGAGWTKEFEKSEDKVGTGEDPRQTWRKKSVGRNEYPFWPEVIVSFSDTANGAVCKRQKVGTRIAEIPIYEWTCPE